MNPSFFAAFFLVFLVLPVTLIYLGKGVAHGARSFWHDFRSH